MSEQRSAAYYAVIPANVRYDTALLPLAKLLYGELTSLSEKHGFCWATNDYFAALYKMSERTVSRMIKQLEDGGYIRCEMAPTSKGSERRIYVGNFAPEPDSLHDGSQGGVDTGVQGGVDSDGERGVDTDVQGGVDSGVHQNNININTKQDNPPKSPQGETAAKRPRPKAEPYEPEWFNAFWARYPRKDNKQQAIRAWNKLKPDRDTCLKMAAALERDKRSRQWTKDGGEFIPHPATWINGRRWEDKGVDGGGLPTRWAAPGGWADDPEVIT